MRWPKSLILPTYTDPWGLVVNEAMACGLPVILSRVGRVRRGFGEGELGTAYWSLPGMCRRLASRHEESCEST